MVKSVFQITGLDSYPTWCKTDDGRSAPMRELLLKDVTEDPVVDEVLCVVYGVDAFKHYDFGEYVLATLDIVVGYNEDETRKQEIRARRISKIKIENGTDK